jgi:hypothetical protein
VEPNLYFLGTCNYAVSTVVAELKVRPDGFRLIAMDDQIATDCSVISMGLSTKGYTHFVKARCRTIKGQTFVRNYGISSRLFLEPTDREP